MLSVARRFAGRPNSAAGRLLRVHHRCASVSPGPDRRQADKDYRWAGIESILDRQSVSSLEHLRELESYAELPGFELDLKFQILVRPQQEGIRHKEIRSSNGVFRFRNISNGWLAFELGVLRRLRFTSVALPFTASHTSAQLKHWKVGSPQTTP